MQSHEESAFNRAVAEILTAQYEQETGIILRLVACDRDFPDLVCQSPGNPEFGIELVEAGLFFVAQENQGLSQYEHAFAAVLAKHRPVYKGVSISLQISHEAVSSPRQHRFPKIENKEGGLIIAEFEDLISNHREKLLAGYGGLLREFAPSGGASNFSALLRHFDAIIINPIPATYPGRPHADDALVALRHATQYGNAEIAAAVERAFRSKDKGSSYTADLLVLHTVQADHKPYYPGTAMHAAGIVAAAVEHLPLLKGRFDEVWFLNAYINDGKRLYRVK